ncbi:sulfatase [Pontiella sp.]|uniref:sulfatase n=1 Tax=Pontiella sp. TaxID=2837462 RepID=UPI003562856F
MKTITSLVVLGLMVAGAAHADRPDQPNVLLLCIDDLRPELNCFGATHIHSPNIDRLAAQGRAFQRHYVNAPSCGPSRCTMLTGRTGAPGNEALFLRAKQLAGNPDSVPPSMPEWFRTHGFTTVSVGKVSHNPGGRGGPNWDNDAILEVPNAWDRHLMPVGEWETPLGAMHGLAHGKTRPRKGGSYDVFESAVGPDTIYPDGLIAEEGLRQLEELAAGDKPFFLAIGLIKPHLPFGAPKKYLDLYDGIEFPPIPFAAKPTGKTTWHASAEFMKYNRWGKDPRNDPAFALEVRRHYAACVSYADKHVGDILAKLKATGADRNTIIVLWGDHGWQLGEHGIWGKHSLFEEALRSPLIVVAPGVETAGQQSDAVVESLDIFPTLCDLAGVATPDFAQGVSLLPILKNPDAPGHPAIAYQSRANTIRTDRYRLIVHQRGEVELYDHATPEKETVNIASDHPDLVALLKKQLAEKLENK